jgi:hypothetical protein
MKHIFDRLYELESHKQANDLKELEIDNTDIINSNKEILNISKINCDSIEIDSNIVKSNQGSLVLDSQSSIQLNKVLNCNSKKIIELLDGDNDQDACTLAQLNSVANSRLLLSGAVAMEGNLNLGSNNIINASNVVIGSSSVTAGSVLNINSTIGALTVPRMTLAQRNAISSPLDGSILYDTSFNKYHFRQAGAWISFYPSTGGSLSGSISLNNYQIDFTNMQLIPDGGSERALSFNCKYNSTTPVTGFKPGSLLSPSYRITQNINGYYERIKFQATPRQLSFDSNNNNLSFTSGLEIDQDAVVYSNKLMPLDNSKTLGENNASTTWSTGYVITAFSTLSQRSQKQNISELSNEECLDFILGMKPSKYQLISGTSGRYHYGFIADEVKANALNLGYDIDLFAPYTSQMNVNSYIDEETGLMVNPEPVLSETLRYQELCTFLYGSIKKLHSIIETLEARISVLENN